MRRKLKRSVAMFLSLVMFLIPLTVSSVALAEVITTELSTATVVIAATPIADGSAAFNAETGTPTTEASNEVKYIVTNTQDDNSTKDKIENGVQYTNEDGKTETDSLDFENGEDLRLESLQNSLR